MKPRKPGSLKEACALLVQRCGGQGVVAGIWKCSAQNVARMTDSDSPQHPPRLDQILVLEGLCREPIVTRFMAGELNCIVEPVHCASKEPLAFVMGKITKETGEMLSAAAVALKEGKLTPVHAAIVLRETDDVLPGLIEMRVACLDVLNGGAP